MIQLVLYLAELALPTEESSHSIHDQNDLKKKEIKGKNY